MRKVHVGLHVHVGCRPIGYLILVFKFKDTKLVTGLHLLKHIETDYCMCQLVFGNHVN